MRTLIAAAAILSLGVVGGCVKSEVSEGDSSRLREEFSQDSYEEAMIQQGKADELEAEKQKEAQYIQGGGGGQEGP